MSLWPAHIIDSVHTWIEFEFKSRISFHFFSTDLERRITIVSLKGGAEIFDE